MCWAPALTVSGPQPGLPSALCPAILASCAVQANGEAALDGEADAAAAEGEDKPPKQDKEGEGEEDEDEFKAPSEEPEPVDEAAQEQATDDLALTIIMGIVSNRKPPMPAEEAPSDRRDERRSSHRGGLQERRALWGRELQEPCMRLLVCVCLDTACCSQQTACCLIPVRKLAMLNQGCGSEPAGCACVPQTMTAAATAARVRRRATGRTRVTAMQRGRQPWRPSLTGSGSGSGPCRRTCGDGRSGS